MSSPYISVVIPVYNEQDSLELLYDRLTKTLDEIGKPFEIILTNDGSKDRSSEVLKQLHERRPQQIRVIEFNRNYGQHMAIMAGLEHARGQVVFTMDADLQNFPEDMPRLLEKIEAGHDVVGGYRENRQDHAWRLFFSRLHNWLRMKFTKINMRDEGCMLRAYTREIVQHMIACEESSTFIPALAVSFASNPTDVPVRHAAREQGKSNYNFYKLVRYNFDFFANFSRAPLEFFTITGFIVAFLSLLLFIYLMIQRLRHGPDVQGVFTLFAILYFLVGVLLMGLGIVGEYIGRIYEEVRKRPRFIIRRILQQTNSEQ
jgi:undecaprenyl-phosphate 4-deoxy-4-formamido-L-arabinose transferase